MKQVIGWLLQTRIGKTYLRAFCACRFFTQKYGLLATLILGFNMLFRREWREEGKPLRGFLAGHFWLACLAAWAWAFFGKATFVRPRLPFSVSLRHPFNFTTLAICGAALVLLWFLSVVILEDPYDKGRLGFESVLLMLSLFPLIYLGGAWVFSLLDLLSGVEGSTTQAFLCTGATEATAWVGCLAPISVPLETFQKLGWALALFCYVPIFSWFVSVDQRGGHVVMPKASDIHGAAQLATREMILAAGLTGRAWGEGFRLCEDGAGNVIRYCGKKDGKPQPNSIAILGPPRCGKLASIAAALVVENSGSMVIIDPRAEILCITLRTRKKLGPVKIICPMLEGMDAGVVDVIQRHFAGTGRLTDSFNILDTLNPKSKAFAGACDDIAITLIQEEAEGKNKHFTDGARDVVSGVIMALKLYYNQEQPSLARVCKIIGTDEVFTFAREAVELAKAEGGNEYLEMRLAEFAQKGAADDKQVKESWRTAKRQLRFMGTEEMKDALLAPKTSWRFNDLKSGDKPMTVYLVNPPGKEDVMAQFNRLLISTICKDMLPTPKGNQHVTILADEFPLLGRIPELEPVFTMGGGAGVSLILIAQSVSQMTAKWGQHGWDAMQNGLDLTLYFPTHDRQTVDELVRRGGSETVVTMSYNYSPQDGLSGISHGETGKPVLDGHELASLAGRCFISAPRMPELKGNIIEGHMRTYWDCKDGVAELCDENPWHKPPTSTGAARPAQPGV